MRLAYSATSGDEVVITALTLMLADATSTPTSETATPTVDATDVANACLSKDSTVDWTTSSKVTIGDRNWWKPGAIRRGGSGGGRRTVLCAGSEVQRPCRQYDPVMAPAM
eukprot:6519178-Prymnesium_polylepis.1